MAIRYRNAGFTLLEVLITLVIAGLLISLASLPSRAIRALNWSKPASSWRCYSSPQPMKRTFAHGRLPGSLSVAVTGSQSVKTGAGSRCAMRSTRRETGRGLWIGFSLKLSASRRTYPPSALYSALKVSRSPLLSRSAKEKYACILPAAAMAVTACSHKRWFYDGRSAGRIDDYCHRADCRIARRGRRHQWQPGTLSAHAGGLLRRQRARANASRTRLAAGGRDPVQLRARRP